MEGLLLDSAHECVEEDGAWRKWVWEGAPLRGSYIQVYGGRRSVCYGRVPLSA